MVPMCSVCWESDPDEFFTDEHTLCMKCCLDGWHSQNVTYHDAVLINIMDAEGDH